MILVEIIDSLDIEQKFSIIVKIFEKSRFPQILIFVSISGNYLNCGQNFWTSRLGLKLEVISILVNIFGRIFIWVKIFEKSGFSSKFLKISIPVLIFENKKIANLVEILENKQTRF